MKKTYISPAVKTFALSTRDGLLEAISNTVVSGDKGGWVKEEFRGESSSNPSSYNVWDDDWSK